MNLKVYFPLNDQLSQLPKTLSSQKDVNSFLNQIEKTTNRSISFFDEILSGFIVLRDNNTDNDNDKENGYSIGNFLKHVTLSLDLKIQSSEFVKSSTSTTTNTTTTTPSNETNSTQLNFFHISGDPNNLLYNGLGPHAAESGSSDYAVPTLIWKFDIPITYPKKKIMKPKLILNIIANVRPPPLLPSMTDKLSPSNSPTMPDDLSNGTIDTRNLLQGIVSKTFDTENNTKDPYIPVSAITSPKPVLAAAAQNNDQQQANSIILRAKFSIPVYPILTMRLKSVKIAGQSDSQSILATLELSSSKEVFKLQNNISVLVSHIEVSLKDGEVIELFDTELTSSQILFENNTDTINLTYRLVLHSNFNDEELVKPLNIRIVAIPRTTTDMKVTTKKITNLTEQIEMKWITNINFASPPAVNLRKKRPPIASAANTASTTALLNSTLPPPSRSVSSTNLTGLQQRKSELKFSLKQQLQHEIMSSSSPNVNHIAGGANQFAGLKFTMFGKNKVQLGEIFKWNLQIINNSNRTAKLLILLNNDNDSSMMMDKKFPKLPQLGPSSSNGPNQSKSRSTISLNSISRDTSSLIQPQINLIRNYNANKLKTSGIVCMNNEIRIDNLEARSVIYVKFDIMAIQKGMYNLEGVKIVNLLTGENYSCAKLLQAVVD